MSERQVRWRLRPDRSNAAVLLLPGGEEYGTGRPAAWNLPALRMRPFARTMANTVADHGVAVAEVRYRHTGWNGDLADAALDATAAIDEVVTLLGPVPLVLVGHSMGGRAALRAAVHPAVRDVVGLGPWCPKGEPAEHLEGRRLVVLQAERDRSTHPDESLDYALRARASGAEVCRLLVRHSGHGMLGRAGDWHAVTARLVAGLLGLRPLPADVATALRLQGRTGAGLDLPLPARHAVRVPR